MKKLIILILITSALFYLTGCSKDSKDDLLNPDKPITVTVWHYYNGTTKEAFDNLVNEFNESIGMEKGIVVDAQSQGDVNQLAEAVFDAANESLGSLPMPNIFAAYSDNAFRVHAITPLVSLDTYFSQEELNSYRKEFLEEGQFITDNLYYIMPVAKSSETLYINNDIWGPFSKAHGFTSENLSTWEGLYDVAEAYFMETGKAFFGLDANANYLIVSSYQLNEPLYTYYEDGKAEFHFSNTLGEKVWNYYYRPYLLGYFKKSGRFSSDDAKTGDIVCYTGSTAGAPYFPKTIAINENETMTIEPLVLPYPYFKEGVKAAIQQGAGMSIAKSDEAHEYAAYLFLKWFTEADHNLKFAVSTGYFPSKNEALDGNKIMETTATSTLSQGAVLEAIKASNIMFNEYALYNNKSFIGSYNMRVLLETHLFTKIQNDLSEIEKRVASVESRDVIVNEYLSEEAFEAWLIDLNDEANLILSTAGNE